MIKLLVFLSNSKPPSISNVKMSLKAFRQPSYISQKWASRRCFRVSNRSGVHVGFTQMRVFKYKILDSYKQLSSFFKSASLTTKVMSSLSHCSPLPKYGIESMPQFEALCEKIDPQAFQQRHYQLLETCDTAGVQNSTKYLAMVGLLKFICHSEPLNYDDLTEVVFASIFMACQAKNDMERLQQFMSCEHGQKKLGKSDMNKIKSFKAQMVDMMGEALSLLTPFDLVEGYCEQKAVEKGTRQLFQLILTFALSLPMFCQVDALHLYLTSLITGLRLKGLFQEIEKLAQQIPQTGSQCIALFADIIQNEYVEALKYNC